jgi:cell division protease FtsH
VGNISFYDPQQETAFIKPYSEETSKIIDQEVRKLIDEAYDRTKKLLNEKKAEVEKLAGALLEREVLFQSDVEALIGKRPFEEKKALVVDEADVVKADEKSSDATAPVKKEEESTGDLSGNIGLAPSL